MEFQAWLLSVTDIESESANLTIAGDALRVLSSALSAPTVRIPPPVLEAFLSRLNTFLASRNELLVLSGNLTISGF